MWQIIVPAMVVGLLISSGNKPKKKKKCAICRDENTKYKCTCGDLFCKDCADSCSHCDNVICTDCQTTCKHCGEEFCSSCVASVLRDNFFYLKEAPAGCYCQGCWDLVVVPLLEKYAEAKTEAAGVTCVSKNYRGRIRVNPSSQQEFTTDWWKDKDEAEYSLKVIAAYHGYTLVHGLSFEAETSYDGNYAFRRWSATGIAGHKE